MPLYEYRCLECERVTEVLQKVSDRPLRRCKACSGKLEKLISRTSFLLKGGGWFAEGYGDPPKSKPAAKSSEKPKPEKTKPAKTKSSASKKD